MKIVLPKYATNYNLCPIKNEAEANELDLTFEDDGESDYVIYWGLSGNKLHTHKKYGIMETGYFHEAAFIDTIGSYQCCSLNSKKAFDEISQFELNNRKSAKEIIFNTLKPSNQSKYNATFGRDEPFLQSVVLACQNDMDKSIGYPHSSKAYWVFIEECCKYYGKNLFVKLHPWNNGDKQERYREIAKKYSCEIDKCQMSLIKNKEFVISFNSTIAIDCILRDVPYVQYALGTFWNCFGIHYSNYTLPYNINPIPNADKLVNFLIYRYCFNKSIDKNKYAEMIKSYSVSNQVFPLTEKYSYANNI